MNKLTKLNKIFISKELTNYSGIIRLFASKRDKPRSVADPPLQEAPVSQFFKKIPNHQDFYKKISNKEKQIEDSDENVSKELQHGLNQEELNFLLNDIPASLVNNPNTQYTEQDLSSLKETAHEVLKILSIENSNGRGIRLSNIQRCIKEFGKNEFDTGSSEVQVSIVTLKIRNIEKHLEIYKKDKHNRRNYTMLLHKRAKILRYLKRKNLESYFMTLKKLGLTQEMVEGEIPIYQKHH